MGVGSSVGASCVGVPCPHATTLPPCRATGLTEIRGPYYTPLGPTHLRELLQVWLAWPCGRRCTCKNQRRLAHTALPHAC